MTRAGEMLASNPVEVGVFGTSQGGWVAPLAATRVHADFVLVGYGLAHSPAVEDQEQVFQELRDAGYGADVLARAREVTDATTLGVSTAFAQGIPEIAAVKARYGSESWFSAIRVEYTGDVLSAPLEQLPALFREVDVGTSWGFDPLPTLRSIGVPMLWVVAGDDHEAPSALTIDILTALRRERPNLALVVFPTADHEIEEYVSIEGRRVEIGYSSGYLPLLARWMTSRQLRLDATNAEVRFDLATNGR